MICAVVYVGEPALGLPSVRTKLSGGRGRPPLQMVRQNVGAHSVRPWTTMIYDVPMCRERRPRRSISPQPELSPVERRGRRSLQMVKQNVEAHSVRPWTNDDMCGRVCRGGSFNKKGRPEGRPLALNLLNCSYIAAEPLC